MGIVVCPLRVTLMTFRARSMLSTKSLLSIKYSYEMSESYFSQESYFERNAWQIAYALACLLFIRHCPGIVSSCTNEYLIRHAGSCCREETLRAPGPERGRPRDPPE